MRARNEVVMECLECPRAYDCHDQVKNDMQIILNLESMVAGAKIQDALQVIRIFKDRLKKRNTEITGR